MHLKNAKEVKNKAIPKTIYELNLWTKLIKLNPPSPRQYLPWTAVWMCFSFFLGCAPLLFSDVILLFFQMCSSCFLRCAPLLFSDAALLQSVWSRGLYSPGKKLLEAGAGLFKWGCLVFLEKLGEPSLWIQWPQLWHSSTAWS